MQAITLDLSTQVTSPKFQIRSVKQTRTKASVNATCWLRRTSWKVSLSIQSTTCRLDLMKNLKSTIQTIWRTSCLIKTSRNRCHSNWAQASLLWQFNHNWHSKETMTSQALNPSAQIFTVTQYKSTSLRFQTRSAKTDLLRETNCHWNSNTKICNKLTKTTCKRKKDSALSTSALKTVTFSASNLKFWTLTSQENSNRSQKKTAFLETCSLWCSLWTKTNLTN